jgi:tetratricopeptide (TPR) repeat protein
MLGREAEARRAFERAAENDFAAIRRDPTDWLGGLVLVPETCAFLGDADRAAVLYELLRPYAHLHLNGANHLLSWGSVARYVGLLAMTLEQWEAAEEHFEKALSFNARIGSPPAVARTEHDYATMLLRRGRPGDADRAQTLAAQAQATAEQLGMARLVEEASVLKQQAASRPGRR